MSFELRPGVVCKNVYLMLVRNMIGKMLASSMDDCDPQSFSMLFEPQLFSNVGTVLVICFKLSTRRSFVAGRTFKKMTVYDMEYM